MSDNKISKINNNRGRTVELEIERPNGDRGDRFHAELTPYSGSYSERDSDLEQVTEQDLRRELLRQARLSFNWALGLIITSSLISIISVGLFFSGRVSFGRAAAAGELASKAVSWGLLKLAKDSSDRLDADIQNLNK